MISIALINPPLTVPAESRRVLSPPLGLAYLAAILRQNPSNQVEVLDAVAEGAAHESLAMPGFVTLGLSLDELQMRLATEPPAIAGITFASSDQARNAHGVCERIKELKRDKDIDITTIAGGPHVTALPYDVMADLNVDFAVVGEGEIPMFKLCEAIANFRDPAGIPGVCYRDRQGVVQVNRQSELVPDLDLIPFPARDLMQMQKYTFADSTYGEVLKPFATMVLQRGCEFKCLTCEVPRIFGETYRKRSPGNIVDEIRYLKENYRVREVQFVGDNLFGDRKWALSWMHAMREAKLEVAWSTLSGQALHNLDVDLVNAALESGMRGLVIDFPTADEEAYAAVYKRPGSLAGARELVNGLLRAGVHVTGLFSLGAPGETRASMTRTVNYALGLGLREVHVRVLTPFPGTPLWDECADKNLFESTPSTDQLLLDGGYIQTAQFTSKDVNRLRHMARTRIDTGVFLSKPDRILKETPRFLGQVLLHPFDSVVKVFRFMGSYAGLVSPPERGRRRRRPPLKKKPPSDAGNP